ncbi:S41 family peptidase [Sphingobacterium spiritivorum]|uniref:S41 family peptidase n=1 Tax=Sphingobacterium spiritivorum TaxID=258 RepID=UPI00191AF153|nr:S41 family peptidase [Sphingobacterium spiritivorum]QQT26440.1 peptidase S41 [Sphingobacterium spiritivorum]
MKSLSPLRLTFILFTFAASLFTACKKEDAPAPAGTNKAINQWIMSQMKQYYYWSNQIPSGKTDETSPDIYFKSLLVPQDHFSSILQTKNTDTYGNTLANTFGFDFIQISQNGTIHHIVSQVVPYSQAQQSGLSRGDTITTWNDQLLTPANVSDLTQEALGRNTLRLTLHSGKTLQLASAYIAQPVVYTQRIIQQQNNIYGYLYLSHFDFSGAYDVIRAVDDFRQKKITDLILDMRYNAGGQVSFAAFCSLLLAKVQANDIFLMYQGNASLGVQRMSFAQSLSRQPDGYSFTAEDLHSKSLQLSKIYILSTSYTASAAELLINNLSPYIEIIHIGETTMGKDMASVTLTSPDNINGSAESWHILPLVYKLYNKNNKGDYNAGLIPQFNLSEHSSLPLYPFGSEQDPYVAFVLSRTSSSRNTSLQKAAISLEGQVLYHSDPKQHKPLILSE